MTQPAVTLLCLLLVSACSTTREARGLAGDALPPGQADAASTADATVGAGPSDAVGAPDGGAADASDEPVSDAGATDAGLLDCDTRKITCRRAALTCGELETPAVDGACYGPCVPIDACACRVADDCPDRDRFTCHLYAQHCGPYVH